MNDKPELKQDANGTWWVEGDVGYVKGSVKGTIQGDVGYVLGSVWGDVGSVNGNVNGSVWGVVKGDVKCSVWGTINGREWQYGEYVWENNGEG